MTNKKKRRSLSPENALNTRKVPHKQSYYIYETQFIEIVPNSKLPEMNDPGIVAVYPDKPKSFSQKQD